MELGQVFSRGRIADVLKLHDLPPLPETREELNFIAQTLGAETAKVYLGSAATETAVKQAQLTDSRVIGFATHGLVSGELPGLSEPGLVLTPPTEATLFDDGILTASEITQLKLDADWVILSACNTGVGNRFGGIAFDTLTSSFFYAGARALLVSHWPVWSDATTALIKQLFSERTDPAVGRSEALRRAMVSMIDNSTHPSFAHPQVWGPFVVVGEGGQ